MDVRGLKAALHNALNDILTDQVDRLLIAVKALGSVKFVAQPHLAKTEIVILCAPEILDALKKCMEAERIKEAD